MTKHILLQAPAPKPVTTADALAYYPGDVLENLSRRAGGRTREMQYTEPALGRIFTSLPVSINKIIKP